MGLWPDAHSTHGSQARRIGKEPSDIGSTPYVVEAKRQKALNVHQALEQAERAADASKDERTPIVVWRRDGSSEGNALVVMRLEAFEALHLAQREGWEAA